MGSLQPRISSLPSAWLCNLNILCGGEGMLLILQQYSEVAVRIWGPSVACALETLMTIAPSPGKEFIVSSKATKLSGLRTGS